jgi:tripartite-type tricarboxylate transporter receptor subunit TctC
MSRNRACLSMYLFLAFAAVAAMSQGAGEAAAQGYPSKVVRIVVPASPGGAPDIAARVLAAELAAMLKQPFIVDNRGGAAGIIGTQLVAQATPDGHTLLVTFDSFAINPLVIKSLPYDATRDFVPVMQVSRYPHALYVQSSLGVKTVKEFVALAKQNAAKLNFGSPGPASSNRLAFELFKDVAGIEMATIQYKGGGPTRLAMISGEVQVMLGSLGGIMQQNVRNGKLTVIGVSTLARWPLHPELPTIAETYPGFETQSWVGMFAPASTPKRVIGLLHATLVKILAEPGMKERFEALDGAEIVAGTPEALARLLREDQLKWGRLIRKNKITLD